MFVSGVKSEGRSNSMENLEHIGLGPEKTTVEVCTKICTVHMHINTHIGLGAEMSHQSCYNCIDYCKCCFY